MTRTQPDELALLRAANPVHAGELPEGERAGARALLERIVEEPAREPERPAPRHSTRGSWRLTLAGAASVALATVAALLAFPGGKSADAVAQAVAALSGRDGVFRVVTQTTTVEPGGARTRTWTQTWASADGRRDRSLIYDSAADGSRGRLIAEAVGSTTVTWSPPRDGGAVPAGSDELAVRPRSYVLALLRGGRVTTSTAVTIAGRSAWRFEIKTRVRKSFIELGGRRTEVPAYTRDTVLIVDRRTDLPVLLRTTGVVPTEGNSRDEPITFPRPTTTARFSVFERITDAAGAAGLTPSRRYQRRSR